MYQAKFASLHRGYASRDIAHAQWQFSVQSRVNEVWGRISGKPLEIEARFQRTTSRKWPMKGEMVT